MDVGRHKDSSPRSFVAIDSVHLRHCAPESSIPIDCSEEQAARASGRRHPSAHYVCAGGAGVPCLDAASMLCDLKPDCPDGTDEEDDICGKEIEASTCAEKNKRRSC